MEQTFKIEISAMTKQEYIQTATESIRRLIAPAFAVAAMITVAIAFAINDFSVRSIVPPFAILAVIIAVMWVLMASSWKSYPKDTSFSYVIDDAGWELTVQGVSARVDWQDTQHLTIRRHVVLLYNESNRSNVIPRRALTQAQLAQIRAWYRDSRRMFKARQRFKDQQYLAERRARRVEADSRLDTRRRKRR